MTFRPSSPLLCAWLTLLAVFAGTVHAAEIRVVASIKPVHSLVAGIMEGVAKPKLLIGENQSPHDFVLKPSDMRALNEADLIIWVGPDIETSLARLLEKARLPGGLMALSDMGDLALLSEREGAEWESHEDETPHPSGEAHQAVSRDSHIWLSPDIARQVVLRISQTLIRIDPMNAERYRTNSQRLNDRLTILDRQLQAVLSPVRDRPYIVFHDAYHYFEQHYGLHAVGSVSISPERMPGARRIHQLREKITRLHARCVFAEPQFEPRLIHTLVEGTPAKIGQLDPLGSGLAAGPEAYFQLMQRLADNLSQCLK